MMEGLFNWRKLMAILCNRHVPCSVKAKVYRMVVRPAIICGMETMTLSKRLEKRLNVAEMKMLKFLYALTR